MDQKNYAILQRLIVELDDTRELYLGLGRMLTSPHAKYVVERIVLLHCAIAEDLIEHALVTGAQRVRRGSMLGKLYARCGAWWTTTGAAVELSCLLHIERREAKVVGLFCAAAEHAPGLQQRLHRHLVDLEYVSARVACTLDGMDSLSYQVRLLAAGAGYGHPRLATSRVPNQPLALELRQRQESGGKMARPAGQYGAESADAVPEGSNTRPRMNGSTPSPGTLISSRDDHATSGTRLVARVRPFPQTFAPITTPVDAYRPSSLFRPAGQSTDPETDSPRPWDRPGKFYEHVRHPSPLGVTKASATPTPVAAD